MRFYTKEEDAFLIKNRDKIPAKRMAKMLGRHENTARQRMKVLGCVPTKEAIERFKKETFFKKGRVSENKGKKQVDYMSAEAIARCSVTRYGKGNMPPNHKPVGYERVSKEGYREIKIQEPNKFKLVNRVNYEKAYGEIPKGMMVKFKDGNKLNCEPDNLFLCTKRDNMMANTLHNYPKEIAQTIQLRGALNRQINKHLKNINNEK